MKKKCIPAILLTGITVVIFSMTLVIADSSDSFVHTVKKGESISLLCIEFYGHYSQSMGTVIQQDNQIKNINLIYTGQKIRFKKAQSSAHAKKPVSIQSSTKTLPDTKKETQVDPDTLFVKKIGLTQGVVTFIEGSATLTRPNKAARQKLAVNTVVYPGDIIETASNGRVEIIINRESVVRLRENTRMNLEELRDNAQQKGKTRIDFTSGTIWTKVKKFRDRISRFELELPTAVAGVHGTVYETTVSKNKSCEVKVFNGEVAVTGSSEPQEATSGGMQEVSGPLEVDGPQEVSLESWTKIVRSMQKISIDKEGNSTEPVAFDKDAQDEWQRWNEERDNRIAEIFSEI